MKVLDISFNSFGSPASLEVGKVLAKALKDHSKLFHLDISHNKFNAANVKILGSGLATNHHIMGVHVCGNEAQVDSLGFVNPD